MTDAEPEDLEALLLRLFAELREMNIRVGTLRELVHEHLGISEAQYAAALAKVTAAAQVPDGEPGTKH